MGDPTLTIVGFEQPKANRVRTSATLRHRNDSIGETAVDELTLSEQRLELAGAYSPTDRISLSLMMPLVHRLITEVNLAEASIWAPGDLDFRLRGVIWRDRKFAPRHLVSLIGGLEFPTSSIEYDTDGVPLPLEFQAGTGSWDPIAGAAYTMFFGPLVGIRLVRCGLPDDRHRRHTREQQLSADSARPIPTLDLPRFPSRRRVPFRRTGIHRRRS